MAASGFLGRRSKCSSRQRAHQLTVHAEVDYYNVLGVDKDADKKTIKQAYRWLRSLNNIA